MDRSITYPVLMSKEMTNRAAMPGGDSIEEREISMPRGFLVASDGMIGEY